MGTDGKGEKYLRTMKLNTPHCKLIKLRHKTGRTFLRAQQSNGRIGTKIQVS